MLGHLNIMAESQYEQNVRSFSKTCLRQNVLMAFLTIIWAIKRHVLIHWGLEFLLPKAGVFKGE